jgi:hypothetical protein
VVCCLSATDETDDDGVVGDWSPETIAALFRALESIDADVSPQLVRSMQSTINVAKDVGREFGLMTESEILGLLGPSNNPDAHNFTLRYRSQTLYPGFLLEPSPDGPGPMRARPLMKDLKIIADKYGWNGSDVVLWMTSPTTWFADESSGRLPGRTRPGPWSVRRRSRGPVVTPRGWPASRPGRHESIKGIKE